MSDDKLPTAAEIVAALEQHPKLFQEVLRRMVWTCQDCEGEGGHIVELDHEPWLDLERCDTCEGSGSLPQAYISDSRVNLGHMDSGFRPIGEITIRLVTSAEGARVWAELIRRHHQHPLARALDFG